jgi:hypothetical protein
MAEIQHHSPDLLKEYVLWPIGCHITQADTSVENDSKSAHSDSAAGKLGFADPDAGMLSLRISNLGWALKPCTIKTPQKCRINLLSLRSS